MVAVDHIDIFASVVSCEAMSGSSVSSFCKCCEGAASHSRLPVLHRVNELCKRTGEKLDWGIDYRNHRAETHCKNAGVSRFGAVDKL